VLQQEEYMLTRIVSGGALPAIAGAAMLLSSYGPSAAFTLSSPSLERPVAAAGVEHVWWDRWGRWHPNRWGWGYRPWGWHPWGWGGSVIAGLAAGAIVTAPGDAGLLSPHRT
jgi:hypothetical protein